MIVEEYNNEEYLIEDIRFFKTSLRVKSLSNKISKKIALSDTGVGKEEVMKVVRKLDEIAEKFKGIEERFRNEENKSRRHEIQAEYYRLEEKYIELMRLINSGNIVKLLKGFGVATLLAASFFTMYHFFFSSGFGSAITAGSNYNPSGENVIGNAVSGIGSNKQRFEGSELRRIASGDPSSPGNKIERSTSWNDVVSKIGGNKSKFLNDEKVVSRISSGYATLGVAGIVGLFLNCLVIKKLIACIRRQLVYWRSYEDV